MTNFFRTLSILAFVMIQDGSAGAQDIKRSTAEGRLEGDLVQVVHDQGESEVNIGSIIAERGQNIHDVHTNAHVKGDIKVNVSKAVVKLNIGSVTIRR